MGRTKKYTKTTPSRDTPPYARKGDASPSLLCMAEKVLVTRNQERLEVTIMRDCERILALGWDLLVLTRLILARPAGGDERIKGLRRISPILKAVM